MTWFVPPMIRAVIRGLQQHLDKPLAIVSLFSGLLLSSGSACANMLNTLSIALLLLRNLQPACGL
jgi:hypothetical protein